MSRLRELDMGKVCVFNTKGGSVDGLIRPRRYKASCCGRTYIQPAKLAWDNYKAHLRFLAKHKRRTFLRVSELASVIFS